MHIVRQLYDYTNSQYEAVNGKNTLVGYFLGRGGQWKTSDAE